MKAVQGSGDGWRSVTERCGVCVVEKARKITGALE
jgi:hypothetical protein